MATLMLSSGETLYYKDWGEGRPVVLCHGWPLNADMWDYQMMALAGRGHRIIAHDRRGFGRSSQPWGGYDYDTFADDLGELIDELALEEITLVGFSMGGGEVARYLARRGGNRVARAALISAVTPVLGRRDDHPNGVEPSMLEGIRDGILADRAEFFRGFGRLFYSADREGAVVSEGVLVQTLAMALQASLKGTVDCVGAFGETDFRPDMAAFTMPTLIVHGDDDQIVPIDTTSRLAAEMIGGARLEVYEGAPHGLPFTHKDRLNQDLAAFIEG